MRWSGEQDRLTDEQIALHKSQLRRLTDMQLQRSYEMYRRTLHLEKGEPPAAAHLQYFIRWRELRRRSRAQNR